MFGGNASPVAVQTRYYFLEVHIMYEFKIKYASG